MNEGEDYLKSDACRQLIKSIYHILQDNNQIKLLEMHPKINNFHIGPTWMRAKIG